MASHQRYDPLSVRRQQSSHSNEQSFGASLSDRRDRAIQVSLAANRRDNELLPEHLRSQLDVPSLDARFDRGPT
jgi:hypothetical protein